MVVGPMKKRMIMSFAAGFLIMVLISSVIMFIGYKQYDKVKQQRDKLEKDLVLVCVTARDVKAGEEIKPEDLVEKRLNKNSLPIDVITSISAISSTQKYAKIDLPSNTMLLTSMMFENEIITDDMRLQEFNMILLPSKAKENDFIDLRLLLPTGNDYVVASKKRIVAATNNTIWLNLGELDMQYVSSAIIESYLTEGSILYAIVYSDAGLQSSAKVTYPILSAVKGLISTNPNIIEQVKTELSRRLSTYTEDRAILDEKVLPYAPENAIDTISQKVKDQVKAQQEERVKQLQAAAAAAAPAPAAE